MYIINSRTDKPNIDFMVATLKDLVEYRGIRVENLNEKRIEIQKELDTYSKELFNLTGIKNPRSHIQIQEYFCKLNDEDTQKYIKNDLTGGVDTSEGALLSLSELGRQDAILLLQCRKLNSKMDSIKNLMKFVDTRGYIKPKVSTTVSNRINYTEPALMNISKEILWDVIKPEDGFNLWSVDIKNQEPHIIAYYLDIPEIKDIIEKGNGIYETLFSTIFPDETLTEVKRSELKTIWNALTYGASYNTIKQNYKNIDGKKVCNYFKKLQGIKNHKKNCKQKADNGFNSIETYFGTTMESDKIGSQLVRSLMDLAIQGTGADILALLIEHFYEWLSESPLDGLIDIYYTRHDELILSVSNDLKDDYTIELLTNLFTHKVDNWKEFSVKIKKITQ